MYWQIQLHTALDFSMIDEVSFCGLLQCQSRITVSPCPLMPWIQKAYFLQGRLNILSLFISNRVQIHCCWTPVYVCILIYSQTSPGETNCGNFIVACCFFSKFQVMKIKSLFETMKPPTNPSDNKVLQLLKCLLKCMRVIIFILMWVCTCTCVVKSIKMIKLFFFKMSVQFVRIRFFLLNITYILWLVTKNRFLLMKMFNEQ